MNKFDFNFYTLKFFSICAGFNIINSLMKLKLKIAYCRICVEGTEISLDNVKLSQSKMLHLWYLAIQFLTHTQIHIFILCLY